MLHENRAKKEDFTKNNILAAMYRFFAMDIWNCRKTCWKSNLKGKKNPPKIIFGEIFLKFFILF